MRQWLTGGIAASLLALMTLAGPARAQQNFGITPSNTSTQSMSVTTSSSSITLDAKTGTTVVIANTGSNTAYITNTATATTTGFPLPAGNTVAFNFQPSSVISAITSTSTTTLLVGKGSGATAFAGGGSGGGGGGGGAVTLASGAVASGAYSAGSIAAGAGVDGWDLTQGAKADSACGTATGTCSVIALLKFLNTGVTSAIPVGTNLIGDVNIRQGGTALSATNGIFSNLLQGNAVLSATNGLFANVLQGNVALSATNGSFANVLQGNAVLSATNPSFAAQLPTTTGGLSVYNVQPAASDNHIVIKAGAGQVYKVDVFNNSATVNYIRLYNATTGFNGCNSATNIVWQGIIPASTSGAGLSSSWDLGIAFATGISICVTSGYAQTDTTNATASALIVNVGYK